jgi:hypothetical protein
MRLMVVATVMLTMAVSCGDDDVQPKGRDASQPENPECLDRAERYTDGMSFDFVDGFDSYTLHACAPTCPSAGSAPNNNQWPQVSALPAGACSAADTACEIAANPCRCSNVTTLSDFRCACNAGRWHCVVIALGGGICPNDCDAGI